MLRASHFVAGLAGLGGVLAEWTTETQWATTTCWSTKDAETLWDTTTIWQTQPPEIVTKTITDISVTTEYDTITDYSTDYDTITKFDTVTSSIEVTTTEVDTVYKSFISEATITASASTLTKYITVTETIASLATSVTVVPGKGYTSTIIVPTTETITAPCSSTTSILSGLVLCPTRITNTDYSAPTPLPTDYTWGCPPGQLCKPKQVNCNFEVGPPAVGYVCSPDECIPTETLPGVLGGPFGNDYNSTCPWYETFDDYFNLPPPDFGLTYGIFAVSSLGIAAADCTPAPPPPPPPSSTTTTTPPPPPPTTTTTPPPPPPPPTTTTTEWVPWTPSTSVYTPPASTWATWSQPPASTWASWSQPPVSSSSWAEWVKSSSAAAVYPSPSTWDDWQSSSYSAKPTWSPPSLRARQADTKVPAECYNACNGCGVSAQATGKVAALCAPGGSFENLKAGCQSCITAHKSDIPTDISVLLIDLTQFIDYCNRPQSPSAPAEKTTATTTTTSKAPPPPRTTTTTTSPPPPAVTTTTSPAPPAVTTTTSPAAPPPGTTTTPVVAPPPPGTPATVISITSTIASTPTVVSITTTVGSSGASGVSTSPAVATFTGGGAMAINRPAPVGMMIVGVVVILAMV